MDKETLVKEAAEPQVKCEEAARVVDGREVGGTEIRETGEPEAYLFSDFAVNTEEVR